MKMQDLKRKRRAKRKQHVRKVAFGSPESPRLTVSKSSKHIYAQIINDVENNTIVSASTLDKEIKELIKPDMSKVDKAKVIGAELAKRAVAKDIKIIKFDRNGYIYHGRVKALGDAARKGGLEF